jgi:FkbH-like protein
MVLRKEHVASLQIHWGPKSESLAAIARDLGIGLEHVVFIDDNPVECSQIAELLPMVTVIPLPEQPELYQRSLLEDGWFDSLTRLRELGLGSAHQYGQQVSVVRAPDQ